MGTVSGDEVIARIRLQLSQMLLFFTTECVRDERFMSRLFAGDEMCIKLRMHNDKWDYQINAVLETDEP
jgi:hypothetical protein